MNDSFTRQCKRLLDKLSAFLIPITPDEAALANTTDPASATLDAAITHLNGSGYAWVVDQCIAAWVDDNVTDPNQQLRDLQRAVQSVATVIPAMEEIVDKFFAQHS